jgi:hypothetical protein
MRAHCLIQLARVAILAGSVLAMSVITTRARGLKMKMNRLRLYLVCVVAVLIYGWYSLAATDKAPWRAQMGQLLNTLTTLVPEMMSDTKESDDRFKVGAQKLVEAASKIDQTKPHGSVAAPDADPALKYLSHLFFDDMKRMGEVISEGNITYAKSMARSSVSYCIACHTRNSSGAQFPLQSAFSNSLKDAGPLQKLQMYAATRQYDAAFNEAMSYFRNPQVKTGDQERVARIGLMVAVRAKESPELALLLVDEIQRSKISGDFLKTKAMQWQKDLKAWQKEYSVALNTDQKLIDTARKLLNAPTGDEGARDLGAEIRYLRASSLMHKMLATYPDSKNTGEALFLIGNSYDVMGDLGYWNLGEAYFEACIDKVPHTSQAKQCFDRYKDSVIFGYSGSSGIHLPGAVQRHLDTLEKKATKL